MIDIKNKVIGKLLSRTKWKEQHDESVRFKEATKFSIAPLHLEGTTLSSFIRNWDRNNFLDFLNLAKEYVAQYSKTYIQEDIFYDFKNGLHVAVLTLDAHDVKGLFLIRIPTVTKRTYKSETETWEVLTVPFIDKDREYVVEYLPKGLKETNPIIAGKIKFNG